MVSDVLLCGCRVVFQRRAGFSVVLLRLDVRDLSTPPICASRPYTRDPGLFTGFCGLEKQDASHFLNGSRITLGRMPRIDDQLRLHTVNMRALVFHHPIVSLLNWA